MYTVPLRRCAWRPTWVGAVRRLLLRCTPSRGALARTKASWVTRTAPEFATERVPKLALGVFTQPGPGTAYCGAASPTAGRRSSRYVNRQFVKKIREGEGGLRPACSVKHNDEFCKSSVRYRRTALRVGDALPVHAAPKQRRAKMCPLPTKTPHVEPLVATPETDVDLAKLFIAS